MFLIKYKKLNKKQLLIIAIFFVVLAIATPLLLNQKESKNKNNVTESRIPKGATLHEVVDFGLSEVKKKDYKNNQDEETTAITNLAMSYYYAGDYKKSNDILFDLQKKYNDNNFQFSFYKLLALNFIKLNDKIEAKKYIDISINKLSSSTSSDKDTYTKDLQALKISEGL